MKIKSIKVLAGLCLLLGVATLNADALSDIDNYHEYSPLFSSSGQPGKKQLKAAASAGFKRVIYLAFSDNKSAIESEDRVVKSLGMDYIHIPVDFEQPSLEDFETFAAVMNNNPGDRTLLHCQINLRASAFSFLYRVIDKGVPVGQAKSDLDEIWQPNKTWYTFILKVLDQHEISHECDSCDWAENEFND